MMHEQWTLRELKKDNAVLPEHGERWWTVTVFALYVHDLGHINVPPEIRAAVVYVLRGKELLLVQGF